MATLIVSVDRDKFSDVSIHDIPKDMEIKIEQWNTWKVIRLGDFQITFHNKE